MASRGSQLAKMTRAMAIQPKPLIQQFYLDHKIFTESFLRWNQTPFDWNGDILTAHFDEDVTVEFEQAGEHYRIKNLEQ